ncbi:MAG: hypothetical protein ACRCW1_08905 [Anaerotignaceae bacterium]
MEKEVSVGAEFKSGGFTKEQLLKSKRYCHLKDLFNAIFEDGKIYTHDEVEKKIKEFKKGRVK